jgi:hypothetical protein
MIKSINEKEVEAIMKDYGYRHISDIHRFPALEKNYAKDYANYVIYISLELHAFGGGTDVTILIHPIINGRKERAIRHHIVANCKKDYLIEALKRMNRDCIIDHILT